MLHFFSDSHFTICSPEKKSMELWENCIGSKNRRKVCMLRFQIMITNACQEYVDEFFHVAI